jgi:hypothetical protein
VQHRSKTNKRWNAAAFEQSQFIDHTGTDVYGALDTMLSEVGYSLEETNLAEIAAKISKIDARIAEQFAQGAQLPEQDDAE